ncbi:MAG: ATP-binding protein [Bacteriovoracaceae bacterium]
MNSLKKSLSDKFHSLFDQLQTDRSRFLLDKFDEAVATLEPPHWHFSYCNPAALNLFGASSVQEFCSMSPWEISPLKQPDGAISADKAKRVIKIALENGSHTFEWVHKKVDGTEFYCNVFLNRVCDGDMTYIQAIIRDMSKERQLELQIIEAQAIAKTGSWFLNLQSLELQWSFEMYKIFEIDPKTEPEVLLKLAWEKIHPEDHPVLDNFMAKASLNGEDFVFNYRLLFDGGKRTKFVQVIAKAIKDNNGKTKFLKGTCRDRTEDIDHEKKYSTLLESMNEGLIVHDSSCNITQFNSAALKILELNANVLMDKASLNSIWRLIKEDGNEYSLDEIPPIYALKKGVSVTNVTLGLKNKNGIKWLKINSVPIEKSTGRKVLTTFTDITEIVRSNQEHRLVMDSLQIGVWKYNLKTKEHSWDKSMYKLYDLSVNGPVPFDAWIDCLSEESKALVLKVGDEISQGAREFNATYEIKTPEGHLKFIGSKSQVICDQDGVPEILYGVNWDKTKEIELEMHLEKEKVKVLHNAKLASIGALAAGVGHEINNPLAIISGQASIISDELRNGDFVVEEAVKRIEKITSASERIAHIVKGLRTFARSDESLTSKFDINELVFETVELFEEIYKKEGVRISVVTEKKPIYLMGNRGKIQQVLVNLISNAKDATEGEGDRFIEIVMNFSSEEILISIRDNGCGISDEIREKIFDPFFTTKEVNQGTGIGLPIALNIIKEHNGKLTLDSEIGRGSTFNVILPAFTSGPVILKAEDKNQSQNIRIECKILIVDDEEDIREVLETILLRYCTSIHLESSAQSALEYLDNHQVDLIISDIKMPKIDGFKFLNLVRSKLTHPPKFLFISGGVEMDEHAERAIQSSDGILSKPFKKEVILNKLKELFPKN